MILPARFDLTIAIAAVNRPVTARLKGDFGFLTTLSTNYGEHLARLTAVALRLACLAALGAALRLVGIASGLEKLLLISAESEDLPTIGTCKRLILKTHWMTSSLFYLVRARSSNT
jgi:hypothetical protein